MERYLGARTSGQGGSQPLTMPAWIGTNPNRQRRQTHESHTCVPTALQAAFWEWSLSQSGSVAFCDVKVKQITNDSIYISPSKSRRCPSTVVELCCGWSFSGSFMLGLFDTAYSVL